MLEQKKQAPVYTNWLEGYNMSVTGEEKKQYLDMGLALDSGEENQLRKKLWEKRFYGTVDGAGVRAETDGTFLWQGSCQKKNDKNR